MKVTLNAQQHEYVFTGEELSQLILGTLRSLRGDLSERERLGIQRHIFDLFASSLMEEPVPSPAPSEPPEPAHTLPTLTDEQIDEACSSIYRHDHQDSAHGYDRAIARAVLAAAQAQLNATANTWRNNPGRQPVTDGERVDLEFSDGGQIRNVRAGAYHWGGQLIVRWRPSITKEPT